MPDTKLSALTALTGATVEQLLDSMPIVDNSVTQTKKILVSELENALFLNGTPQTTTSGVGFTFSIPNALIGVIKKITLMLNAVSTSGTSPLQYQLKYGSSTATSGYVASAGSRATETSSSTGFILTSVNASARTYSGVVTFTLENSISNIWVTKGLLSQDSGAAGIHFSAGSIDLPAGGQFVGLFFSTVGGTDTFDAGEINILYE